MTEGGAALALRRDRLAAQGLTSRAAGGPAEVVRHLLAVQAQDLRAARLTIRSRTIGCRASEVDDGLADPSGLVIGWLNRGTLHLVEASDYWWLHGLVADRQRAGNRTRLGQEGVSPDQAQTGVDRIRGVLRDEGPQTRDELRTILDDVGVPTAGQALVHVLSAASIAGELVRGPVTGREQRFVHAPSWLGAATSEDRDEVLARLASRYLAGHGPADPRDLARWVGLPLGDARRAFAAIADRTEPWDDERVVLAEAAAPGHRSVAAGDPAPRLLGGFDPVLHGWDSRTWLVPTDAGVVTTNGIFRPTVLVDGQVVGTWTMPSGSVVMTPLPHAARWSDAIARALELEAADVSRFLAG